MSRRPIEIAATVDHPNRGTEEAAVPAAILQRTQATRLPLQCRALGPCYALASRIGGFTLADFLVSMFVLLIIVFMVAQMMTTATAISRNGQKHVSTDTQARTVF